MVGLGDALAHLVIVLLVAAGALHVSGQPVVPPAERQAAVREFVLTDRHQDAGALATYGGVVAWWGTAGDDADVRLTVWRPGGRPHRLPVVPGTDPSARQLDVGRGPDGAVWVTYVVCGPDPCRPRGYDLETGADQDLDVGAGVAASMWGNRVAVVRQQREGARSRLEIVRRGGAHSVTRQVQTPPFGDVEGLDLRGDHVALAAWEPGGDARALTLAAGRPSSRLAVLGRGGSGEECTQLVTSPTLTATALTWMAARLGSPSTCGRRVRELRRRDWATHATVAAPITRPAPKQAVVAAGRVVALFATPSDGDQGDRGACLAEDRPENPGWTGCQLRVTSAPRWAPARTP